MSKAFVLPHRETVDLAAPLVGSDGSKKPIASTSPTPDEEGRGDLIRPENWAPAPRVSSDGLGWVGLQVHRVRALPGKCNTPAFTHHMLLLFVLPPPTLDWNYDEVRRHAPPPAGAISLVPAGRPSRGALDRGPGPAACLSGADAAGTRRGRGVRPRRRAVDDPASGRHTPAGPAGCDGRSRRGTRGWSQRAASR